MDKELLKWIADNSAPNKSPTHPHGYCFVPEIQGERLATLVPTYVEVAAPAADKSVPAKLTDAGAAALATPVQTAQQPMHVMPVQIEDNVPLPPTQRFGRGPREGGSLVDKYPFASMEIGQSFFIPGTVGADKPMHRTFASVVSNANKKLYPRSFAIRADNSNGTAGARIWREADLTAPRPQRARKASSQPEPQPQTGQQPTFGQPAFGEVQAPAGFSSAPGAFPAPGAAPGGFPPPGGAAPSAAGFGGAVADAWGASPAFGAPLPQPE